MRGGQPSFPCHSDTKADLARRILRWSRGRGRRPSARGGSSRARVSRARAAPTRASREPTRAWRGQRRRRGAWGSCPTARRTRPRAGRRAETLLGSSRGGEQRHGRGGTAQRRRAGGGERRVGPGARGRRPLPSPAARAGGPSWANGGARQRRVGPGRARRDLLTGCLAPSLPSPSPLSLPCSQLRR